MTSPNWDEAVLRLTGGRGVDHVLEVGGDGTIQQSIRATKDGGRIASIGNLSGGFTRVRRAERGVEVTPIAVGSRQMNSDLMRAIDMHRQMPVIDSTFPFADLKRALGYMEAGKHFGKIVITF
ncbi:zinc-binding dehydrogenase [Peristeroidobacter soli]|uniref:zinc-binding dehydrogenase n=1 Tax=Peristeroidobacter soli TaxID=2497877 RepID=UPI00101BBBB9|nr:zinc-binding dehydrogenase [Peristeroidobacter soli]